MFEKGTYEESGPFAIFIYTKNGNYVKKKIYYTSLSDVNEDISRIEENEIGDWGMIEVRKCSQHKHSSQIRNYYCNWKVLHTYAPSWVKPCSRCGRLAKNYLYHPDCYPLTERESWVCDAEYLPSADSPPIPRKLEDLKTDIQIAQEIGKKIAERKPEIINVTRDFRVRLALDLKEITENACWLFEAEVKKKEIRGVSIYLAEREKGSFEKKFLVGEREWTEIEKLKTKEDLENLKNNLKKEIEKLVPLQVFFLPLEISLIERILSDNSVKILFVFGHRWANKEIIVFEKNQQLLEFSYSLEQDEGGKKKKKFSHLEAINAPLSNICYYEERYGIRIKTKITNKEFIQYLRSEEYLSSGKKFSEHFEWRNYHFAEFEDVTLEVLERQTKETIEKVTEKIDKYKQKRSWFNHSFQFGINDRDRGERIRKEAVRKLIEVIREKRPDWIRYSPNAYELHGSFFVDDGSTMGVLHPNTPVEVKTALTVLDKDEILLWLTALLEGKVSLSGETVGQSSSNTCPKCGSFATSFATRQKIFYRCSFCGFSTQEENLASFPTD